jgi:hypothetical protein
MAKRCNFGPANILGFFPIYSGIPGFIPDVIPEVFQKNFNGCLTKNGIFHQNFKPY